MTAAHMADFAAKDAAPKKGPPFRINGVKLASIGVPAIFFSVFFLGPFVYLVLLSFWHVEDFRIVQTYALDNYADIARNLFSGSNYGLAMAQTLWVAVTTAVSAVALCYALSLSIVFAVPLRWQRLVILLAVAPFWTSYILRVYAWQVLLAKRGVINSGLAAIGLGDWKIDVLYTQIATRIGLIHYLAPILIVILVVAIRNVDRTLIEAARQLGATRLQVLWRVVLPLTRGGIILSLSFALLVACGDVLSGSILGGGAGQSWLGKLPLYANTVIRAYASSTNMPHTAALAMVLIAVMAGLLLIAFWVSERTRIVAK